MPITSLDYVNKNQLRRYPFVADCTLTSTDGTVLPDSCIVDAELSTVYGEHDIYVSQLWRNSSNFSITISAGNRCLGNFTGVLKTGLQQLRLNQFVSYADGWITLYDSVALATVFPEGAYYFDTSSAIFEASKVFCYTRPAVRSISDGKQQVVGHTGFGTLVNLFEVTGDIASTTYDESNTVSLSVDLANGLQSLADLATVFGNCPTPFITEINNTVPYPTSGDATNDGNIYMVGVLPIQFIGLVEPGTGTAESGAIGLTTTGNADSTQTLTLQSMCVQSNKLIAPVAPLYLETSPNDLTDLYWSKSGLSATHTSQPSSSLIGTNIAEYTLWPQFKTT